jgi:integration host factor subunit beta
MTRSELISVLIKQQPHLSKRDVELAVNCILKLMVDALDAGDRIEIRGFGSFDLRQRDPRVGRNPKTGEVVNLPAKVAAHFKPGKELRDRVNAARSKCSIKV